MIELVITLYCKRCKWQSCKWKKQTRITKEEAYDLEMKLVYKGKISIVT